MLKFVILACFAVCFADACSQMHMTKVKHQWNQAYSYGEARENFDEGVWEHFFQEFPETKEKFFTRVRGDNIYSPDFRAHMARVMGGVDMLINLMRDTEAFNAQLAHLKAQHAERGVEVQHYEGLGRALMHGVHERVGHCFDKDAWVSCLNNIKAGIV
eukprot:TRINITY_DN49664_c0_g1_i1.p2 TRINITY_DN49664_c0_g1~~TRINITY_DN49664_c0_g1_i1.p2  ORF type:complete len:158 (-),score=20.39 TRINITY_DN49664_c0_g1_i1:266-739(-)